MFEVGGLAAESSLLNNEDEAAAAISRAAI